MLNHSDFDFNNVFNTWIPDSATCCTCVSICLYTPTNLMPVSVSTSGVLFEVLWWITGAVSNWFIWCTNNQALFTDIPKVLADLATLPVFWIDSSSRIFPVPNAGFWSMSIRIRHSVLELIFCFPEIRDYFHCQTITQPTAISPKPTTLWLTEHWI